MVKKLKEGSPRYMSDSEFMANVQANPTWKKVEALLTKYGYRFSRYAAVRIDPDTKKKYVENVGVINPDVWYKPKIHYDNQQGFYVETRGCFLETYAEIKQYAQGIYDVEELIGDLEEIDYTTLYTYEASY